MRGGLRMRTLRLLIVVSAVASDASFQSVRAQCPPAARFLSTQDLRRTGWLYRVSRWMPLSAILGFRKQRRGNTGIYI
jgi:hypothetical protein